MQHESLRSSGSDRFGLEVKGNICSGKNENIFIFEQHMSLPILISVACTLRLWAVTFWSLFQLQ